MGCDIHVYVEELATTNGVTAWNNIDFYRKNRYFVEGNTDGEKEWNHFSCFMGRDYSLFAVLADVRNYADVTPIAPPRGLPKDVSDVTREASDRYGIDGHSHSWFTLKELFEAEAKYRVTKETGLITPAQAEALKRGVLPEDWCQGSSDKTMVRAEWDMPFTGLTNLIDAVVLRCEPYMAAMGYSAKEIRERFNLDRFRIVFWFDN